MNKNYLEKLSDIMRKENIDVIILGPSTDLEYITNFTALEDERFQGLFLLKNGERFYISPELNAEEIEGALDGQVKVYSWSDSEGFLGVVEDRIREYGLKGKRIVVNKAIKGTDLIDMSKIFDGEFINGTEIIENSRIIKTDEEIRNLRKAAEIADMVMGDLVKYIRPGLKEQDIKNKIEELFIERGGHGLAFDPIVASGSNSSMPHYNQSDRVIGEKDIVIIDMGCKYNRACSDISRTFFIGDITEEEREVYNIVRKSNLEGVNAVKEGITAEEVDKKARNVIAKAGYGDYFLNRTGHGIGFSVHEAPYIREGNKQVLESGMAFSVEPGIYLTKKFGMRIEDIVVVGKSGPLVLNKFNRDIIVI